MDLQLDGRFAVVTGASRGIGLATARRLAAEGVRYTRAYSTAPVCSASRSAFMTGMYQTTIGAHNHRSHRDDGYRLPPGVKVATDWFRAAGYFTANVRTFPDAVYEIKVYKGTGKEFDCYPQEKIKLLAMYDPTSNERELIEQRKSDDFPDVTD